MKIIIYILLASTCLNAQEISWVNIVDGSHFHINKIISSKSNELYLIGTIKGKPDFRSLATVPHIEGNGGNDIFIQKRSSPNDVVWTKIIGGQYDEEGIDIQIDPDGNLIALCNFNDEFELSTEEGLKKISSKGEKDILFLKLDVSGRILWAREFGSKYTEISEHLQITQNGLISIAGQANGTIDFDPSNSSLFVSIRDYFLAYYDLNGDLIRAHNIYLLTYGTVKDVLVDQDQNAYITGQGALGFHGPYANSCFVQKLDKFGNDIWFKFFDQNDNSNSGNSLIFDNDSNLVIVGTFYKELYNIENNNIYTSNGLSDIFLATYDQSNGILLSFQTLGDTLREENPIIIHDKNDGYLIATNDIIGNDKNQIGLKKYYNDYYTYNYSLTQLNKDWTIKNQLLLSNGSSVLLNTILLYKNNSFLISGTFNGRFYYNPLNPNQSISSESNADVFIQQLDSDLKENITLDLGGTSLSDGIDMVINDDGSVIHIGNHIGEIETNLGVGNSRLSSRKDVCLFIQKIDANGNRKWIKNIQGTNDVQGLKIHKDPIGDLIITGSFAGEIQFDYSNNFNKSSSIGDQDYFILKLDANGNFKWVKTFGSKLRENIFDSNIDDLGNIYIAGIYSDSIDFDPSNKVNLKIPIGIYYNAFVQKLNSKGELIWVHSYDPNVLIWKLEISENDNIILLGNYNNTSDLDPSPIQKLFTSKGQSDIFITKMNSNGQIDWVKSYGGKGIESGESLKVSNSGEIFITGYFTEDMSVNNNQLINKGNNDIFIIRVDKAGNLLWSSNIGGASLEQSRGLYLDNSGNYYIYGFAYSSIDLDQGPSEMIYSFSEINENFLVKYDQNNKLVWVYSPNAKSYKINSIKFDEDESFFITGSYVNVKNCSFNVNQYFPLYNSSIFNSFLIKANMNSVGIANSTSRKNPIEIFPDPVQDMLNVEISDYSDVLKIEIYNLNGNLILSKVNPFNKDINLNLNSISSGLYILKIRTKSAEFVKRFCKI
ncbi:MAG: T9SS type A sorting domain-containing protein [Saprospiraceae bacterium]